MSCNDRMKHVYASWIRSCGIALLPTQIQSLGEEVHHIEHAANIEGSIVRDS